MRFARAEEFQGYMKQGRGGAMRFRVQESGGEEMVVVLKPLNGPLKLKDLATDLLCSELAHRLGLPCPEPVLVDVPRYLATGTHLRNSGAAMEPGLTFATSYIPLGNSPLLDCHILRADNKDDVRGIDAFDTWVHNTDRHNDQNTIATPSPTIPDGFRIWIIDHDACLGGPLWSPDILNRATELEPVATNPRLANFQRRVPDTWATWVGMIVQLSHDTIREVVGQVPTNWLAGAAERSAVRQYLERRQFYLDQQLSGFERRLVLQPQITRVC